MTVSLQPVRIAVPQDETGQLVFVDGRLVAVLVQLSPLHGKRAGRWFVEVRFGSGPTPPEDLIFADLNDAQEWFAQQHLAGV